MKRVKRSFFYSSQRTSSWPSCATKSRRSGKYCMPTRPAPLNHAKWFAPFSKRTPSLASKSELPAVKAESNCLSQPVTTHQNRLSAEVGGHDDAAKHRLRAAVPSK